MHATMSGARRPEGTFAKDAGSETYVLDGRTVTLTGGRLKRVARFLDPAEPFCMTYGDGVADIDIAALVDFHREHGRAATLTAVVPPGRYGALDLDGLLLPDQ